MSPSLSPTTRAVFAGTVDFALSGQKYVYPLTRSLRMNTKTQFSATSQFPAQRFTLSKTPINLG